MEGVRRWRGAGVKWEETSPPFPLNSLSSLAAAGARRDIPRRLPEYLPSTRLTAAVTPAPEQVEYLNGEGRGEREGGLEPLQEKQSKCYRI